MRPIRLKMQNFITYTNEELDFSDLNSRVFLITGKTGAGKTTIFDAIMFALYGEASGNNRDARSLYSNYANMKDGCEVVLEFEHNGKRYKAKRTISFKKPRGKDEYEYKGVDAELEGEDIMPVTGSTNVTKKCEEIIGLNADQFKRIVMLAQGEFKRFLEAKDDERGEILSNLFDVSEHTRFQSLVIDAEKRLREDRWAHKNRCETTLHSFKMPAGLSAAMTDALSYYAGTATADALKAVVAEEEQQLGALSEAREAAAKKAQDLRVRRERCKSDNEKLEMLEKAKRELAALTACGGEMARRKEAADTAETVLHTVKPVMDGADEALRKRNAAEENLKVKRAQLPAAEQNGRDAETALIEAKKQEPRRTELAAKAKALEEEMPRYAERAKAQRELTVLNAQVIADERALQETEGNRAAAEERVKAGEARLTELTDTKAVLLSVKGKQDKNAEALSRLNAVRNLDREADGALVRYKKAAGAQKDALEQRAAAKAEWDRLDDLYTKGIAGELALQLGERLKTEAAACPVCRTRFEKGSCTFAVPAADTVKKADVEKAKAGFEKADKAYNTAETAVTAEKTKLEALEEQTLTAARELFPDITARTQLTEGGLLDTLEEKLTDEKRVLEKKYREANENENERQRLADEQPKLKERVEGLRTKLEQDKQTLSQKKQDAAAKEAALKAVQLSFADSEAAERALRGMKGEIATIDMNIQSADDKAKKAKEAVAALNGQIAEAGRQAEEFAKAQAEADAALARVLSEKGFANRAAAQAVMHDEAWLKGERAAQTHYDADCKNAAGKVEEWTGKTNGLQLTDLTVFDGEITAADAEVSGYAAQEKQMLELLSNHRSTRDTVCAADAELGKTAAAYERLTKLKRVASGEVTGKVDFKRFVLGSDFRDVLEKANVRLSMLSDGHFELEHRVEQAKANKAAGLGIAVRDMFADKTESSGSLSGGEGFMTSMALALGLADVVQARAGGKAMDTVFIDEGFGTLDEDALQNAIGVLQQLSSGSRTVGIISHVSELDTAIPMKVRVTFDRNNGSHLKVVSE